MDLKFLDSKFFYIRFFNSKFVRFFVYKFFNFFSFLNLENKNDSFKKVIFFKKLRSNFFFRVFFSRFFNKYRKISFFRLRRFFFFKSSKFFNNEVMGCHFFPFFRKLSFIYKIFRGSRFFRFFFSSQKLLYNFKFFFHNKRDLNIRICYFFFNKFLVRNFFCRKNLLKNNSLYNVGNNFFFNWSFLIKKRIRKEWLISNNLKFFNFRVPKFFFNNSLKIKGVNIIKNFRGFMYFRSLKKTIIKYLKKSIFNSYFFFKFFNTNKFNYFFYFKSFPKGFFNQVFFFKRFYINFFFGKKNLSKSFFWNRRSKFYWTFDVEFETKNTKCMDLIKFNNFYFRLNTDQLPFDFFHHSLFFPNFYDLFFSKNFVKRGYNNKLMKSYVRFYNIKFLFNKIFFFRNFFFNWSFFKVVRKSKFFFFKKNFYKSLKFSNLFLKSKFLRKSRLYFFFKFYFKSKKFLSAFFSKSSFFRNNFNNSSVPFFSKKNAFFFERNMEIPLNFFLIWVFFKNIRNLKRRFVSRKFLRYMRKKKSLILNRKALRILDLAYRYDKAWRYRMRRGLRPYVSNVLKNFSSINWDFLVNFLIDKFFFKYNVDIKYFLVFVLFFKDFFSHSFLGHSLNVHEGRDLRKFFTDKIDMMCRDLLSSQFVYNSDNILIFFLNLCLVVWRLLRI
jgi:hypothetical protein